MSIDRFPLFVGGMGADFAIESGSRALCEIGEEEGHVFIKSFGDLRLNISGLERSKSLLRPEEDYSVIVDQHVMLLCLTNKHSDWQRSRSLDQWTIRDPDGNKLVDQVSLQDLGPFIIHALKTQPDAIIHQELSTAGFRLSAFAKALGFKTATARVASAKAIPVPVPIASAALRVPRPVPRPSGGEFSCPACQLQFDRGQELYVAVHPSLKGDPVLGSGEMRRFRAKSSHNGQALDAEGKLASEIACPHCRRKLVANFFDSREVRIFIDGAVESNRAIYLAALIGRAASTFPQYFQTSISDAAPLENWRLLDLQRRLFSASPAATIRTARANLDSDWSTQVFRGGSWVRMPKPFIFGFGAKGEKAERLVFYAPEASTSFEFSTETALPNRCTPRVIHFLFDPSLHAGTRKGFAMESDSSVQAEGWDAQESAARKLRARLEKDSNAGRSPVAVIVDKFEIWRKRFEESGPLKDPLIDGKLDEAVLQEQSDRLRSLLQTMVPQMVADLEATASRILYFPSSSLGYQPECIGENPDGHRIFSPDPKKFDPLWVEVPLLWSLAVHGFLLGKGGK